MSRKRTAAVSATVAVGALAGGLLGRSMLRRRHRPADEHPPIGDPPPDLLDPVVAPDGTKLHLRAAGPAEER